MRVLKLKSEAEFYQRVKNGDVLLARLIIDAILHNLDMKKGTLHVASVEFKEEAEYYDLTCHSDQFILTLEKNLEVLVEHELYEECTKVTDAISLLKQNKL